MSSGSCWRREELRSGKSQSGAERSSTTRGIDFNSNRGILENDIFFDTGFFGHQLLIFIVFPLIGFSFIV